MASQQIKAAQVSQWGDTPKAVSIPKPDPPTDNDTVQIKVLAAGIHRVVRGRATGKHFSATKLPHILGADGIGHTVPDGQLVYFSTFWDKESSGSFAEYVNVPRKNITPVPSSVAGTADPVRLAGLVNPAMSSWMAFKTRVTQLPPDFTVLVLGATTTSGKIALSLARRLGASKVFGAARNHKTILAAGYDAAIELAPEAANTDWSALDGHVDLVLDYLYGEPTVALFNALHPKRPVQYVQIGTLGSFTAVLPGALLREKDITIRGSAPGAFSGKQMAQELPAIIEAAAGMSEQQFKVVSLDEIDKVWGNDKDRVVVKIGDA